MNGRRLTLALLALIAVAFVLAAPGALREALERGEIYLFSPRFLADIPKRLAGPGRFRFVLQPVVAALLGRRDGVADARAGRPPYLLALATGTGGRRALAKSGLATITNLLLMGILLDTVFQWLILGAAYPGAALVVGPVLIAAPYATSRALANRTASLVRPGRPGLVVTLHRSLVIRLAAVGTGVALVAGLLTLLDERSRAARHVVNTAVEDTRRLAALIGPHVGLDGGIDAAKAQAVLEAYAATRTTRSAGGFSVVRLYDRSGAVIGELQNDDGRAAQALERAAWPRVASEPRSETFRLDGRPQVHVLAPLLSPAGDAIGAAEGVFRFSDAAVSDIRIAGLRALVVVLVVVLATTAVLYPVIVRLTRRVVGLSQQLLEANLETLGTLGSAIAKRDSDTDAHNFRVSIYALRLGERAGLDLKALRALAKGALLHDVGKIGVRDAVLLKPGKLDQTEFETMKTHVEHGVDIVDRARWLHDAKDVVHAHQEKLDGSGYPRGLRGSEIPETARIFAIADVFDALTSKRPYKDPLPLEKVLGILREGSGTHFEPALLELFLAMAPELHREYAGRDDDKLRADLADALRRYFSGDLGELAAAPRS